MNENNYDVMGDIISKPLTSTIHGSLHFAENVLSAKAAVKYKIGKSQPHTLDFSAKLHDNSRGTVIREGVNITLQVCRVYILYCSINHITCQRFQVVCVCVCAHTCTHKHMHEWEGGWGEKQTTWLTRRKSVYVMWCVRTNLNDKFFSVILQ